MDIKVKKLSKHKWEMHLVPPDDYDFVNKPPKYTDINEARIAAEEFKRHDDIVSQINEELVSSDFTMFSRQAYDRWHWYDQTEMNRFVTYFTLKHGQ